MPAAEPSPARLDLSSASSETHKLLAHLFKTLKLHVFQREYDRVARQCAAEGLDYSGFLLRLAELEATERNRLLVERRIREAQFPVLKRSTVSIFRRFRRSTTGRSSTWRGAITLPAARTLSRSASTAPAKRMSPWGSDWPPARRGCRSVSALPLRWARALVEAQNERRLSRMHRRLASYQLLIVDELGYVPLSPAARSCCSKCSVTAANAAPRWSPATCRSTSGPACSAASG